MAHHAAKYTRILAHILLSGLAHQLLFDLANWQLVDSRHGQTDAFSGVAHAFGGGQFCQHFGRKNATRRRATAQPMLLDLQSRQFTRCGNVAVDG